MRIWKALSYSMDGFKSALTEEQAFREELLLNMVLIPVALYLPIDGLFKLYLIFASVQLLMIELINSAIECAIDRISADIHPLSKKAKDYGSAAVFLACCNLFAAWSVALVEAYLS